MEAIQVKTRAAERLLNLSGKAWLVIAFAGQAVFAYYILMLYGRSAAQGDMERWNASAPHGYEAGDWTGNFFFGLHVALAAVITIGGPLNLLPAIRRAWPVFHRLNGKVYIFSAYLISLAGLYLAWVRGAVGGLTGSVFISINAAIIMICATYAWRCAKARQIAAHERWALRLYLAMSGVWMFRVGLMLWLAIHQAPVGFDPETFQGPFLNALYITVYVLPVLLLQGYFFAHEQNTAVPKYTAAGFLLLTGVGMLVGIVAATMGMWLPRL